MGINGTCVPIPLKWARLIYESESIPVPARIRSAKLWSRNGCSYLYLCDEFGREVNVLQTLEVKQP